MFSVYFSCNFYKTVMVLFYFSPQTTFLCILDKCKYSIPLFYPFSSKYFLLSFYLSIYLYLGSFNNLYTSIFAFGNFCKNIYSFGE